MMEEFFICICITASIYASSCTGRTAHNKSKLTFIRKIWTGHFHFLQSCQMAANVLMAVLQNVLYLNAVNGLFHIRKGAAMYSPTNLITI